MHTTKSSPVRIFGKDLSHLSEPCLFFIGCLGIFILYLIYGAVQEYLFKSSDIKTHFAALTAYQFLVCGLLALLESRLVNQPYNKFPPWLYLSLSLATVGTILLSNAAVVYLNYPTQVIFKCCKLIPVMLGSMIIHGRIYAWIDYLSVVCMIVGLVFFTLTDVHVQPNFEIKGVIAISIALCADGYIGNLQELAMKKYHLSSLQILAYSYVNGFLILFFYLVAGSALVPAIKFASTNPIVVFVYGSLFAVTGYFGIQFVLLLVHHFGALPAVTVTTLRKAVTIVFSFVFFAKPFAFGYLWSGAMVVLGIYLSAYSKSRSSRQKRMSHDASFHRTENSILHTV
ncbi:hypothetical protein AAHC03_013260 [Spirometra sp. Aus1]